MKNPTATKEKKKIIDTSKKAKIVEPVVVQKAFKAKKVVPKIPLSKMSLAELKELRINIAEQINASGVHWIKNKDGSLASTLDQTDYWKVKALVEKKK